MTKEFDLQEAERALQWAIRAARNGIRISEPERLAAQTALMSLLNVAEAAVDAQTGTTRRISHDRDDVFADYSGPDAPHAGAQKFIGLDADHDAVDAALAASRTPANPGEAIHWEIEDAGAGGQQR